MLKLEAGVAINPETPLEAIEKVLHSIQELIVMGIHPGQSGRPFEGEYILEKIRAARNHRADLAIEIDGGVTDELLPRLVEAGATRICAASLLFASDDPKAALKTLQDRAKLLTS